MGELVPFLQKLAAADVSVTAGGLLLAFVISMALPRRWRPFFTRAYVRQLEERLAEARAQRS